MTRVVTVPIALLLLVSISRAQGEAERFEFGVPIGREHQVSPDGQTLAYLRRGEFVLRDIATGRERVVSPKSWSPDARGFVWSGDSRRVLCLVEAPLEAAQVDVSALLELDVMTGDSRQVASTRDYRRILGWSADGRAALLTTGPREWGSVRRLELLNLETGSMTVVPNVAGDLRRLGTGDRFLTAPARHIIYNTRDDATDHWNVRIVGIDGTNDRPLVSGAIAVGVHPLSGALFYLSDRTGTADLWLLSLTVEGMAAAEATRILADVGSLVDGVTASVDGDVFFRVNGRDHIFTVPLDAATGRVTGQPSRVRVFNGGDKRHPAWSPNGAWLAFKGMTTLGVENDDFDNLLLLPAVPGAPRVLRPDIPKARFAGMPGLISWAADGQSILASGAWNPSGNRPAGAHRVDLSTGDVSTLVAKPSETSSVMYGQWLRDGRSIVYVARHRQHRGVTGIGSQVVVRDVESGTEREIYSVPTSPGAGLSALALSTDRRQIAFRDTSKSAIMLLDFESAGAAPRELTRSIGPDDRTGTSIAWAPDGRSLIYIEPSGEHHELWRVPIAGGPAERIGLHVDREIVDVAVHPDGHTIAFVTTDGRSRPGFYLHRRLVPARAN